MSKKKKITIVVGILLFTFVWALFDYYFAVEKTIVKKEIENKVYKVIPESKIISIKDSRKVLVNNVLSTNIPLTPTYKKVEDKHEYNNIQASISFEEIRDNINEKDIGELNDIFLAYVIKENDAIFFKADFTPILERKIGDEVSVKLGGEEFLGVVTKADILYPTMKEKNEGIGISYNFHIRPYEEYIEENRIANGGNPKNDYVYHVISILGRIDSNNTYEFTGHVFYLGFEEQRFQINNKIGVMLPDTKFDNFIHSNYDIGYD
ncbi:MAG: hypothetical protein PHS49_06735 [Candidatus Gracilibacteria bacterium]|nr:hypothetical protein [Candidatus Gracilibacteria bacterium]